MLDQMEGHQAWLNTNGGIMVGRIKQKHNLNQIQYL